MEKVFSNLKDRSPPIN